MGTTNAIATIAPRTAEHLHRHQPGRDGQPWKYGTDKINPLTTTSTDPVPTRLRVMTP